VRKKYKPEWYKGISINEYDNDYTSLYMGRDRNDDLWMRVYNFSGNADEGEMASLEVFKVVDKKIVLQFSFIWLPHRVLNTINELIHSKEPGQILLKDCQPLIDNYEMEEEL